VDRPLPCQWTAWADVKEIDAAEQALRGDFKTRQRELKHRRDETPAATVTRVVKLVLDVAEDNAREFFGGRRASTWTPRPSTWSASMG
jgi:hypothetical protein